VTNEQRLAQVLQNVFHQQAAEVARRVSLDADAPDMAHWAKLSAQTVTPLLVDMYRQGMVESAARTAALASGVPANAFTARINTTEDPRRYEPTNAFIFNVPKSWTAYPRNVRVYDTLTKHNMTVVAKAARKPVPRKVPSQSLFNPRVMEAAEMQAYIFCRETLDTVVGDLQDTLDKLREAMGKGLPRADAQAYIDRKLRKLFTDPARARRIASTEYERAVNGGVLLAALEAGVRWLQWVATANACKLCAKLHGKCKKPGVPFYVAPGGGPYAVTQHPPAHPSCHCKVIEVL
jgi:hypothetical protein